MKYFIFCLIVIDFKLHKNIALKAFIFIQLSYSQVKETGEFLAHTVNDVEGKADEAKKAAIEGFDQEVEKIADGALNEVYNQTGKLACRYLML